MKFSHPFPDGTMSLLLKNYGFQESDIMDIREILIEEIKRQNQQENIMSNDS